MTTAELGGCCLQRALNAARLSPQLTGNGQHRVQQPAVVELDLVGPQPQVVHHLGHHLEHLGVRHHGRVGPGNVEVALEEFSGPRGRGEGGR